MLYNKIDDISSQLSQIDYSVENTSMQKKGRFLFVIAQGLSQPFY
jgi:hypothetical protein